jgi:hypothetical protein
MMMAMMDENMVTLKVLASSTRSCVIIDGKRYLPSIRLCLNGICAMAGLQGGGLAEEREVNRGRT